MTRHPFRSVTVPFESLRTLPLAGAIVALVALAALSGGCIFSPKKGSGGGGGGGGVTPVPLNTTAHGAVALLAYAWQTRDSTLADSVYAENYLGSSQDLTNPADTLLSFTKRDEVHSLGVIQRAPDVTRVIMDFHSEATWTDVHYAGDSPDWVSVQINRPYILVTQGVNDYVANDASFFEFKVKPDTTSSGRQVWRIINWTEYR